MHTNTFTQITHVHIKEQNASAKRKRDRFSKILLDCNLVVRHKQPEMRNEIILKQNKRTYYRISEF